METNWYTPMRAALHEACHSPDPSTQNGAVTMRDGRLVSAGANTFTMGTWKDLEVTPREEKYLYVEHAERMALFRAARQGEKVDTLVAPWAACAECARAIVASGVKTLVRIPLGGDPDPSTRWGASIIVGDEIMRNGGVTIIEYDSPDGYGGVQLRRDHKVLTF